MKIFDKLFKTNLAKEFEEAKTEHEREVRRLNYEINDLKSELKKLQQVTYYSQEAEVDFGKMKAFSIERVWEPSTQGYRVVIGYKFDREISASGVKISEIREWTLFVSLACYERLVKEFEAYKNEK